jgi:hypothetical protein
MTLTKQEIQCLADNNNVSISEVIEQQNSILNKQVLIVKSICIAFILILGIASIVF